MRLRSDDAGIIVLLIANGVAAVGYSARWVYRKLRPGPKPRPLVRIQDVQPGQLVRVIGKVVAGEELIAPITGRRCVAYDAAISWGTERVIGRRGVRGAPFLIDDGTGRATVDPRGAFVYLHYDHHVEPGDPRRLRAHDPAFLAELPVRWDFVVLEGALAIGDTVAVTAKVDDGSAGDDPIYRRMTDARVRLVGAADRPAEVSTRLGDLAGTTR